jgi:hypothetical protein
MVLVNHLVLTIIIDPVVDFVMVDEVGINMKVYKWLMVVIMEMDIMIVSRVFI